MRYSSVVAPTIPHVLNASSTALRRSCGNRVAGSRLPGECLCRTIVRAVNCKASPSYTCLYCDLNRVLGKSGCLGDGAVHCERSWIIRPRIGTGSSASPTRKIVTYRCVVGWRCADRDRRSTVFPSTAGAYRATSPGRHRQVILGREARGVRFVGRGSDGMRYSSIVAPTIPHVLNASSTALRRSCGNRVA